MLKDDPEFLNDLTPCFQENDAMIHHIASAKTDATVAKRILKLMQELGLGLGADGWCLAAHAQTLGHERTTEYPLLQDRAVAVVANHTRMVGGPEGVHLVDTLLSLGVNVEHVFALSTDFGATRPTAHTSKTGPMAPLAWTFTALRGQPQAATIPAKGIDVVVSTSKTWARFYTYVSTSCWSWKPAPKPGSTCWC